MRTSVRAEFLFEVVNLYKVNKRLTHQLRRLMCCGFDWSRILPAAEHVIISNNHETVTFIKRLTNTFYCRIKQTFKKNGILKLIWCIEPGILCGLKYLCHILDRFQWNSPQLSALHSICVEKQSFTHMEDCISLFSFSIAGFDLWKKICTVCSCYLKHQ